MLLIPRLHRSENGPPLTYRLEGGALAMDGRIEARADVEPALRFADGTVIALARGTKGRLTEVDGRGAHVAIADGTASVNVVPKPHARWRVDAGPFVISVHGTVFSAAWNEATGRLDVKLERGSISVEGPVTGGPIAMRAGQRLTVAMRQSRVLLRGIDDHEGDLAETDTTTAAPVAEVAPPPVLATAAATPLLAPAPPGAVAPAPAPIRAATRPARATRSWPSALASGDFATIIAEAEHDCRGRSRPPALTIWRRWPTPPATAVRTIWRDARSTRNGAGSRAPPAPRTPPSSWAGSTRRRAPAWSTPCVGTTGISTRPRAAPTSPRRWGARWWRCAISTASPRQGQWPRSTSVASRAAATPAPRKRSRDQAR